ncbi:ion transporter [Hymenobacter actinosclerus]|uniref:Voltage-gated potassium channel n=1 Tax=Hymenobacter actinosclerus TaxID=82805 RepID=A0A1I0BH67_9BACT|nr:ion transporter [Hymenobacter actinosclerus]SET06238.1 voltage-gated potassium channel [Hymenobacter actinosclerus]
MDNRPSPTAPFWKRNIYRVVFEADTRAGQLFDILLLLAIVLSVLAVMLESVSSINAQYGPALRVVEWVFTGVFLVEYLMRLLVVRRPLHYALSWLGLVDLLAVVPSLLALVMVGSRYLLVVRTVRLLRVFRIFKLGQFIGEGEFILSALKASRFKILVFLSSLFTLAILMGTFMYVLEGGENGFTSIPKSVYWAVVTLTTVGYGDISPTTILGQTLATLLMIMGYAIIAVPTGIVSAQMSRNAAASATAAAGAAAAVAEATAAPAAPAYKQARCPRCQSAGHRPDAGFCWNCGGPV